MHEMHGRARIAFLKAGSFTLTGFGCAGIILSMDEEKKKREFLERWAQNQARRESFAKGFKGAPKVSEMGKMVQSAFAYVTGQDKVNKSPPKDDQDE